MKSIDKSTPTNPTSLSPYSQICSVSQNMNLFLRNYQNILCKLKIV